MARPNHEETPIRDRLRSRGWRITPQRRAVAEALSGPHLHLTADEIFSRAREVVPEISRATVYNTLRELVDMGELDEVQITPGATLYDPNALVHHHHFVCSNCGRIFDVHPRGLDRIELGTGERQEFEVESIEVVFHGLCRNCNKDEPQ